MKKNILQEQTNRSDNFFPTSVVGRCKKAYKECRKTEVCIL